MVGVADRAVGLEDRAPLMPSQPLYEPEDLERWVAEDYLREMFEERAERLTGARDAFPWMGPVPRTVHRADESFVDVELEEEIV